MKLIQALRLLLTKPEPIKFKTPSLAAMMGLNNALKDSRVCYRLDGLKLVENMQFNVSLN